MRTAGTTIVAFIVMGLAGIAPVLAQDMAELEVDHALTFDFPTPHTPWARPYVHGTTRVLFFTDGRGTNARECVELMQRYDIEAEVVFWARIVDSPDSHWHGGETGERRMLNLLGEHWDCYVFMGISLADMTPEQQYKLLRPVAEGAGIVFVGADDRRVLKDENRLTDLPPFLARGPVGDAFTVGEGRGMRLPGQPDIPYRVGWHVEYDYWAERLGRAILWAAGKEPQLNLTLEAPAPELPWGEDATVTARFYGVPVGANPTLTMRVRSLTGDPIAPEPDLPETVVVPPGVVEAALPTRLMAGDYRVDAWVTGARGIEAWATIPFRIVSPPREIAQLRLFQDWGEIGDHIAGTVSVEGEAVSEADAVHVTLLDRRRREIARVEVPAREEPAEFDLRIEPWMPMLVTVEARLMSEAGELSRVSEFFRVTRRNRGQFNFLMWDVPRGTLAPYAQESLAEHAVTVHLRSGTPQPYVAAFDIAWVPYTTRILARHDEDGIMTPFCWNDEEQVAAEVSRLAEDYIPSRQHGVFVYSLGDENETLGACLSPHCARAYREYLREEYGDLDALNASWGTAFGAWDEVGLSQPDDSEEHHSLREGNYPRWFDRQAFKSWNYVKYCEKYLEAYREIDPEALTGFEGAGRFGRGDDVDLLVRNLDFWAPYPGTVDEVLRSIAPRDFPRSNWMGYTKDADSLLQKYWRMVTLDMDAVWWWRWEVIGRFRGWLAPDLRPFPAVREILDDTQVVRDGLGDLLLHSQMQDDGIAILYSYPSTFAHELEEGATYGGYEAAHLSAHNMIRELGLNFRYVTDRMLRLGEFDADRFRVLILPRAEALGDREAEVIREFAEGGGVVIADVRPGLYDERCKPRETGVLDEMFGIERRAREPALITEVTLGDQDGPAFENAKVDPAVTVTEGEALGAADGVPAVITRPVGDGLAVLLNFDMSSYPSAPVHFWDRTTVHDVTAPEAADRMTMGFFEQAGVTPPLRLVAADGGRESNVKVTRWLNDGIEIVALFRQGGLETEASVELPARRHVYDLRDRRDRGRGESFTARIIPDRASFFVLCERAAPTPQVDLDAPRVERGQVTRATVSVPDAEGLHAFRIRARAGDRELDWLDRNIIVGREPVAFDIPVAFNDPVGEYEISAIDLFTNEPTTVTLSVF